MCKKRGYVLKVGDREVAKLYLRPIFLVLNEIVE